MPDPDYASLPLAPTAPGNRLFRDLVDVQRLGIFELVRDRASLGDVFALDFRGIRPVVLSRPDHLRHVLADKRDDYPKGDSVRNFRLIVGNGLFTADGEPWRAHRTLLQPQFRKAAIEGYATQMMHAIHACADRWERSVGTPIDMIDEMMELALDVVGRTMFSRPIANGRHDLAHHYKRALLEIGDREHSISFPMWVPSPSNLRLRYHKWRIDSYITRAMDERRASGRKPGDLLDALLSVETSVRSDGLPPQQILDEIATVLIAGHETSALVMSWAFWLLARHPRVLDRVLAEMREAFGDREPTAADVPSLPYTRAVIDETMRLYPPVWIYPRIATVDDVIGGYRVPAGTMVLISPWLTHRRPELWPDPESFRPERFVGQEHDRYAFLPFGVGARTCAGLAFAYQEIVLALAVLLPRFAPRPTTDRHPDMVAIGTLHAKDGLPMMLERRAPFRGARTKETAGAAV